MQSTYVCTPNAVGFSSTNYTLNVRKHAKRTHPQAKSRDARNTQNVVDDEPYVREDTRSEEDLERLIAGLERLICEADAEEDAVQSARCRVALGRLYRCEMARFDEALQASTHSLSLSH